MVRVTRARTVAWTKDIPHTAGAMSLQPFDEFFIFMTYLSLGLMQRPGPQIQNPPINSVGIWLSEEQLKVHLPDVFLNYSDTQVVLDCTELCCQTPNSLLLQSEVFSIYKSHCTVKGSISDKEILKQSGIVSLLKPTAAIMVDKGFLVEDCVLCKVYIPAFLSKRAQLTGPEGNTVILNIIDRFSKAVHLVLLPKLPSATETTNPVTQHVIRLCGIPMDNVSDQGPQFTSQVWKAFCGFLGATVSLTSGYHLQSNELGDSDPEDSSEELTEAVCLESDLQDGQMMEVEVAHHSVLLTRSEGRYSALGNQCTHYGAPLSKGFISGNRVRCPWHGSCFNAHTGDLEEYPGMDCLPCHKVKIENSKVYVSINKKTIRKEKRIKSMSTAVPGVTHTILLLGGGAASLICAETLRQENFSGRIIMATREDNLPYDKTRLSKVMNVESGSILLRRMEFFHQYDIEVWLRKEALSVDTDKKTVSFDDGSVQSYDQLLISTGCRAKGLDVPGMNLDNVKMLETPEDARQIHNACLGCKVVLVGTSFVGMEVASYLIDKASSITVIGSSELPYQNTLGPEIGKVTMLMLAERDVTFYMNDNVTEVKGVNGKVKEVVLRSGKVIPAEVLIVGIGTIPNSEYLRGSKIQMNSKNFVTVDKYMHTNVSDVFCGGDLATFPLAVAKNQLVNIGHWQMAQAHGRIAALNMLGKTTELNSVPFYWTVLVGKTIRYTGYGEGYTDIVIKGKFEDMKFLALYIKNNEVIAAAGLNFDPVVSAVAERLGAGQAITKEEAQSDDLSWLKLS
ncbi:apoptosis-inducing factor 3-like [Pholidichthys leucotaenia]